ncbi:MAG: SEL1-like repeat protein [Candidatus Obscuribacter sp.]|nr:SEL1-like repeat protein [Candidatus Obscuribacter sp.]
MPFNSETYSQLLKGWCWSIRLLRLLRFQAMMLNSIQVNCPMQTSRIRSSAIVLQSAILLALAGMPAVGQSNGTKANPSSATPQSPISDMQSAASIYPPQNEKYESTRKLLLSGHYDAYVQQLEKSGAEGDMECLDELGNLYYNGRIVAQDRKRAFEIWQELAAKNYGPAMCKLGAMYIDGVACSKDYKKAHSLFSQSSALGCDYGAFGLAYMHSEGQGCKTNYAEALEIYERLCAKDSPLGWYGKSELLWNGSGVKADPIQSTSLLQKAAEAGLPKAQSRLADRYYYGGKIPANFKLARFWAQRGSDQGDVACQLRLAEYKMRGVGGEKDCAGGIGLLKALGEQSVVEAQNRLGHAYHEGLYVKKDLVEAKMWLEKAAARDYVPALNELAFMYFYGDGVPKNLEKAFELNIKGASQDEADTEDLASCQFNVGLAYDHGWGVKQDLNQARIWYAKAAVAGNPHACNNLSLIYLDGRGCTANKDLALSLRKQGVKNGCWMACTHLGVDYVYGRNGVPKNIAEAIRLFKRSLELRGDNPAANYELGRIYEKGLTGKVDLKLADKYYQEAAKYGNEPAFKKTRVERVLSFNTPVTLPKHRSSYVIYDIDPRQAKYFINVPRNINPSQKFGLIVYIDCYDVATAIPEGWAEVLAKQNLLFVCPQNAGNHCGSYRRAGLAVLGALEMMRKYNIDKSRVYAAGTLGGARIASNLGFNQYDVFRGIIQTCGCQFYRKVQKLYPTTKEKAGEDYGLCDASAAEVAEARKNVKFAFITGRDDFRRGNVLNIYQDGFAKEGFRAKLIEVDSIGLSECDGKTLEQALNFLQ